MDSDQRIGMVSILVMRQCDRCRRSQFCLTHLGEHVEWFKTTPKSGTLYDSSGWGEWGVVWPSERPRGKLRSAVMIRFVQWFDLVYYLQCDETTDDCGKHDVACDESGDRGKPGDDWGVGDSVAVDWCLCHRSLYQADSWHKKMNGDSLLFTVALSALQWFAYQGEGTVIQLRRAMTRPHAILNHLAWIIMTPLFGCLDEWFWITAEQKRSTAVYTS